MSAEVLEMLYDEIEKRKNGAPSDTIELQSDLIPTESQLFRSIPNAGLCKVIVGCIEQGDIDTALIILSKACCTTVPRRTVEPEKVSQGSEIIIARSTDAVYSEGTIYTKEKVSAHLILHEFFHHFARTRLGAVNEEVAAETFASIIEKLAKSGEVSQ